MYNLSKQNQKLVMIVVMRSMQFSDQKMNMKLWKVKRRKLEEKFERLMSQNVQQTHSLWNNRKIIRQT